MRIILPTLALCLLTVACSVLLSQDSQAAPNDQLTIYSSAAPGGIPAEAYRPTVSQPRYYMASNVPGYAMVRQKRKMQIPSEHARLTLQDVAAYIDPTTVMFHSLSHGDSTSVLEQNFLFDLVGNQALMERYIDKPITVEQIVGNAIERYEGTLLSARDGLVIQGKDGVRTFQNYSNIHFPTLPEGLITKPTLAWDISTKDPGEHEVEVAYQTQGITWWADYNLVLTEKEGTQEGTIDLSAWVSILNQSGASFKDAGLKLVAGEVQRAEPQAPVYARGEVAMAMKSAPEADGFSEKSFFEYHLYTLGRTTDVPDNSTKQIELFTPVINVPITKEYVFGDQSNKVQVALRFKNDKEHGLGIPLPAGKIRVNKRDPEDSNLEFIGEDIINHTPKDEKIRITMGNAFDIVGERTVQAYRGDGQRQLREEDIQVVLRNHKSMDVNVIVEQTGWGNWEILSSSHPFEKESAAKSHTTANVPKDGKTVVTYTVKYPLQ
jgi:hypothetical protein